jgi:hypothetical protein
MKTNPRLRNDRNIWLTVAAIFSGCALASTVNAQLSISDSPTGPVVPLGDVILTQNTDAGPGAQDNNRDYMNNNGPVGQTFEVGFNTTLDAVTIEGRGDSAMFYSGVPQPFVAGVTWGIQISSVGAGGALTALDTEQNTTYVPTGGGASDTAYLTYDLGSPVSLIAGQEYAFNLIVNDAGVSVVGPPADTGAAGQSWFGLAHGTADSTATEYAENSDSADVNTPGTGAGQDEYSAFAAPNASGYSYDFAAIGAVPEPTTLALIGLGGLGLLAAKRRKV